MSEALDELVRALAALERAEERMAQAAHALADAGEEPARSRSSGPRLLAIGRRYRGRAPLLAAPAGATNYRRQGTSGTAAAGLRSVATSHSCTTSRKAHILAVSNTPSGRLESS